MKNYIQEKLLDNENSDENIKELFDDKNYLKICYKLVSSTNIKYSNKEESNLNKNQKKSLINVLESFNLSKKIDIKQINMKTNSKTFVERIFETNSDEYIQLLLNDFSEQMNTKMKEKDKYVVLVILQNQIILAHTKIGETSINTEFNVFERLLDKDNVMRIVFFENNEEKISVAHYEKNKSKFFTEWLGIPQDKIHYSFGGENKFYSEIAGCSIMMELTDDELDKLNSNEYIYIKNNSIIFKEQLYNLKISHIMRDNKKFPNYETFEEDFLSRKYELKYYQEEYNNIVESLDPVISKIYDDEWEIKKNSNTILEKRNKNIYMLFCNKQIDITTSYLEKIISLVLNKEPIKITHVGEKFSQNPIKIGNLNIYNQLNVYLTSPLIDYYNNNEIPRNFQKELLYVIFHCLKYDNTHSILIHFIEKFLDSFADKLNFNSYLTENELIELKSKDFFIGKNDEIINKFTKDITRKLKKSKYKFYIIGYNEKTRKYDPISSQKFSDDRISDLERYIKDEIKVTNLNLIKIPINTYNCIIYCTVQK